MGIPDRIRVEAPGSGNFCFAFCEVPLEPGCLVVDCVGFWLGCWQGLGGQTPVHLRVLRIQPDCKAVPLPLAVAALMSSAGSFSNASVLLESLLIAYLLSPEH